MNFKSLFNKNPICRFIFNKWRGTEISLHKTFIYNFIAFPFKDAIKFPLWIYQNTKIEHIGKIEIIVPIKPGMIRIGKRVFFRNIQTTIINNGTIVFEGNCSILGGTNLYVLKNKSKVYFGKDVMIGEKNTIIADENIEIGDYTRIAFNSLIMNTDAHYLINLNNGIIKNCKAPIIIGNYNWIGNNTTIKKGTITPDYCIVSSNSMLMRDYSKYEKYSLITGKPGVVKETKFRRIYNDIQSSFLDNYFDTHNTTEITIPKQEDDQYYNWLCNEDINVHSH